MSGSFSEFSEFSAQWLEKLDDQIEECLKRETTGQFRLNRAVRYSLFSGGKRFRPLLLLATLDALQMNPEAGMGAAVALEMVHTYSLIHDDLPTLDNDDFRRGKPTTHKKFGEACALLGGDALLTMAFSVLCSPGFKINKNPSLNLDLIRELSIASGARGMILGQWLELELDEKSSGKINKESLYEIINNKTGRLIACSVNMAALIADISTDKRVHFAQYGREIGILFQLTDDLLDFEKDSLEGANNFACRLGVENTRSEIENSRIRACGAVEKMALPSPRIINDVIHMIIDRKQ